MRYLLSILVFLINFISLFSQLPDTNYDEALVPKYHLPDPLIFISGETVKNQTDWDLRRNEILILFENTVYGVSPKWDGEIASTIISEDKNVFDGLAEKQEIFIKIKNCNKTVEITLLLYLPKNRSNVPVFLGYNFNGNHTISHEEDIVVTEKWVRNNAQAQSTNNMASEKGRGAYVSRWPLKEIISRGYGVATAYYGDIDPDFHDDFKNGVHQLFQMQRDGSSWGTIAAWSWGLSRITDYLETISKIDPKRIIVFGHSRLGKAALWAGASDQRFAGVISNNSGCGGAAISRRKFGETVEIINNSFPHWFCGNLKSFNNKEDLLPIDQHNLIALIAPRPVYIASASDDLWADPKGEFLSGVHASPVYKLLGKEGLQSTILPPVNTPLQQGRIAYHLRDGEHGITLYDWQQYLNYFDKYFNSQYK